MSLLVGRIGACSERWNVGKKERIKGNDATIGYFRARDERIRQMRMTKRAFSSSG